MVLWVARLCGVPGGVIAAAQLINYFLSYWVMLLLPMVSLTSLIDAYNSWLNICRRRRRRRRANQIATVTGGALVSL